MKDIGETKGLLGGTAALLLLVLLASTHSPALAWLSAICGFALLFGFASMRRTVPQTQPRDQVPSNRDTTAEAAEATDAFAALPAAALAAAAPDPVLIFNRSGFVLHANPAAETTFGRFAPGSALPLRFRAPEMQTLVENAVQGSVMTTVDYAERVPLERNFRVSAVPIGEPGKLWALFFQDWSEARRADRMRADFVANASHELRTPLASIAGFAETLQGAARDDPKASQRFLRIIGEQAARMSRLIDDLLSLSRLETKPYLALTEQADLREIARQVVASLNPLAEESGVVLELVEPSGKALVAGSRDELFQVVENLVENACNYGAAGGRVRVAITQEPTSGILLIVQDWGQGIAQEHLPRITERFYRADAQSSRSKRGTGLGLAIVKHIVTRHNARLTVRSVLREGTSFSVHFPPR